MPKKKPRKIQKDPEWVSARSTEIVNEAVISGAYITHALMRQARNQAMREYKEKNNGKT